MRWKGLLVGLFVLVAAILVLAWWDGGREPLRDIAQPVPLPELPQ